MGRQSREYKRSWRNLILILPGRSERQLDSGHISEAYDGYGDAAGAINEFLRPYPEVQRCAEEDYWLARRSADADLAVWV